MKPFTSREVAFIGLGSNLSNPKRNVNEALKDISQLEHPSALLSNQNS